MSLITANTTGAKMVIATANASNEYLLGVQHVGQSLSDYLVAMTGWQIAVTILVILITYDQGMSCLPAQKARRFIALTHVQ
jgi:hypothetical protein